MRDVLPDALERGRETTGLIATDSSTGPNGKFSVFAPVTGVTLMIVASAALKPDSEGWEHVSVSIPGRSRTPNWPEMCFVKGLFWDDEECVIQFHPPRSEYVNNHPYCLHLWKDLKQPPRLPSARFVGSKGRGEMTSEQLARAAVNKFKAGGNCCMTSEAGAKT